MKMLEVLCMALCFLGDVVEVTYNAYFIYLSTLCQREIVSDFAMDLSYKTI